MKLKNVMLGFIAVSAVCVNAGWLAYEHVHPIRDAYYTDSDAVYADGMPKVVYVAGQRWNIEIGMHDEEMNEAEAFGVTLCQERAIHMHSHTLISMYPILRSVSSVKDWHAETNEKVKLLSLLFQWRLIRHRKAQ